MLRFITKRLEKAAEWTTSARQRARRRRSPGNLILIPLGFAAVGATWYGLFRVVWAFHLRHHPQHVLADFWGSGIGLSSFVPSFLMVFAIAPGALLTGMALANCVAWLVGPARRAFDAESAGQAGTGFMESTRILALCAVLAVAVGLAIASTAAYFLKSLR